jgi:hypothetical protein
MAKTYKWFITLHRVIIKQILYSRFSQREQYNLLLCTEIRCFLYITLCILYLNEFSPRQNFLFFTTAVGTLRTPSAYQSYCCVCLNTMLHEKSKQHQK